MIEIKNIFKSFGKSKVLHDISAKFERGKTNLGDKTIADTLDLIIKKIKNSSDYNNDIKSACFEALENFKGKKILIGRARMFEDKTKEFNDPGMFALSKLCEVF